MPAHSQISTETSVTESAKAQPLRVGVIGVGYLGRIHARIYARLDGVDLVGVVDTDAKVAEAIAKECACPAYTKPEELLGKVDAVSIVVPTVNHFEVAQPFIEQGVHLMMEKPIAPSHEESLRLVELVEQKGILMQVGHLERYNAGVMALAKRVKSPRFIEVHRIGTFVNRATDVDVVTDLMIHDIDIVMSLVNDHIKHIAANGLSVLTDHVDIANARLEFENGAVANVTASRVSNKKLRRIRVFEQDHYYGLNYTDQQLEMVMVDSSCDSDDPKIITKSIAIESKPPLDAELEDFVANVRLQREPMVDGRVGLEALEVAHRVKQAIDDSLKQG